MHLPGESMWLLLDRTGLLNDLLEEVPEEFLAKLLKDFLYESLEKLLKKFVEWSLEVPLNAFLGNLVPTEDWKTPAALSREIGEEKPEDLANE